MRVFSRLKVANYLSISSRQLVTLMLEIPVVMLITTKGNYMFAELFLQ